MSTTATMTPDEMLREAGALLDNPSRETVSGWPRAVAVLARMAVESALNDFWEARFPDAQWLNMRAQLNCARVYLQPELSGELSYVWHGLSHATHHHPYELDPTAEELRSLLATASRTVSELRHAAGTRETAE